MDEAFKSIKAFLYDRAVSPLFSAYIAAWSAWNYRVIAALLDGDASFSEKMAFIDNYFGVVIYQINGQPHYVWGQVVHGIFGPILLTLVYLYIYPLVAKPVYEHSLSKQKELKDIKQKVENARLLTVEESRNLIKETEQLRFKANEEAKRFSERIAGLTETINSLESSQNSIPLSNTKGSLVEAEKPGVGTERFSNLVKNKVEALPDGEFELSGLFEKDEWNRLNVNTRKRYGKLFRELVDGGGIAGVNLNGKRSGNQIVYRKETKPSSALPSDFESELLKQYQLYKNVPENERANLTNKLVAYCVKNNISVDMFGILLPLVLAGGKINIIDLQQIVKNNLSNIEIDHVVKKLSDRGLVYRNDYEDLISLTSEGNEMAVDSGLTRLEKELSKPH